MSFLRPMAPALQLWPDTMSHISALHGHTMYLFRVELVVKRDSKTRPQLIHT